MERLRRQCARMEVCSFDARRKALKALDGDAAAAEEILESLVADGYVDDRRYGAAFAREKASLQGWGAFKIRQALSAKGFSREDTEASLASIDTSSSTLKLRKLTADKYRLLKDDPQWKLKLLKFILGRGYTYDEASSAVDSLDRDGDR